MSPESSRRAEAEALFQSIYTNLGTGYAPYGNLDKIIELDLDYAGELAQQMYDRYETEIADLFRFGDLDYNGQTTTRRLADDYEYIWQELVRKGARPPIVSSPANGSPSHTEQSRASYPIASILISAFWTVVFGVLMVASVVGVGMLLYKERATKQAAEFTNLPSQVSPYNGPALIVGIMGLVALIVFVSSLSSLGGR